jgi:HAMP domain-containing protein
VLFCVLFLVINIAIRKLVLVPVSRVTRLADEASKGNLRDPEIKVTGGDELAEMSAAFNRMRRSIIKIVQLLRKQQAQAKAKPWTIFDVSLQLLCTRKPGSLSRIIREINLLGLQYRNHKIDFDDNQTRITINASGELNCTRESLEALSGNLPEVLSLQQLDITRDGQDVTLFKTTVSKAHISAQEQLTPAIMLAAEKRLSDIMGPVASFIVEAAANECRNAGELFSRLADELNDES